MLKQNLSKVALLVSTALVLSACEPTTQHVEQNATATKPALVAAYPASLQTLTAGHTLYVPLPWGASTWRVQADRNQLQWLDAQGQVQLSVAGRFSRVTAQPLDATRGVVAALEAESNSLYLWLLDTAENRIALTLQQVVNSRVVEDLCFYHSSENQQLSLFILGGRGGADQLLLQQQQQWLANPVVIRELNVPYDSKACAVDDASGSLFIAEADRAIWLYQAEPEAEEGRELLQVGQPFGAINAEIIALKALSANQLVALQEEPAALLLLDDGKISQYPLAANSTANNLAATLGEQQVDFYVSNEEGAALQQLTLALALPAVTPKAAMAQVLPTLQTVAASARGDVIDDPAVWHHPTSAAQSLILATDKRAGLEVYNMQGERVQQLNVGRLNNVDVRYGLAWQGEPHDIAVASLRNNNSLQLFAINGQGDVLPAGQVATSMQEIYGLCMYQDATTQAHYVFVNDKSGLFEQYRISAANGQWQGQKVRSFNVPSQPEGCVADDSSGVLFVGEEDEGIWRFAAAADASSDGELIIKVDGETLVDDVEGLALGYHAGKPLLIASSQGNDSYVIYDALPPYALRLQFRVSTHYQLGIDGASETDGLDLTTRSLGPGFEQGAFIVQDGRNRMPEQGQNLKLVPWQQLLEKLN